MQREVITSAANPLIKRIRALEQRKYREQERALFVEGIQPVLEAIRSRAEIETLILAPELLTSEAAHSSIEQQRAAGARIAEVTRRVFESIAEREHPSGLAAIVHLSSQKLDDLSVTAQSIFVGLYEVSNPGNLGTIIRTADAVGASGIILIGETTDPYHPTAVKASRGALFTVPIAHVNNFEELLAWGRAQDVTCVATSSRARLDYWSVEYSLPTLILFGSEGKGLPEALLGDEMTLIKIPMTGTGDSLNLAVSVGVMLYELKRKQRLSSK